MNCLLIHTHIQCANVAISITIFFFFFLCFGTLRIVICLFICCCSFFFRPQFSNAANSRTHTFFDYSIERADCFFLCQYFTVSSWKSCAQCMLNGMSMARSNHLICNFIYGENVHVQQAVKFHSKMYKSSIEIRLVVFQF